MITFDQAKKDWNQLLPGYRKYKSNIYYKDNRFFLSSLELAKTSTSGNVYDIYYRFSSLFNELNPKSPGSVLLYPIKDAKKVQMDVDLRMEKEAHAKLIKNNWDLIKSQFFIDLETEPDVDADAILYRIDHYLETTKPDANKVSIYRYLIQLSFFASEEKTRDSYYTKYIKLIEDYNVIPQFYTMAYKMTKEQFLETIRATTKAGLEETLIRNADFLQKLVVK